MTVQSVGTITANLNAVVDRAGKTAATESFGKLMSSKSQNTQDTQDSTKQTASKETKTDNRISKSERNENVRSTDSASGKIPSKDAVNEQSAPLETQEGPDVKDLEKVLEAVATLLNTITEILTNAMNVTDEEMLEGAADLQLMPSDLLDTGNLKDLFLDMKGIGAEDLIADEDMLGNLNEMLGQIEQLLEDFGVEDGSLFEKLSKVFEGQPAEIVKTPEFNEVLNAYLTAEEPEAVEAEEPAFKVEITDLRDTVQGPAEEDNNGANIVKASETQEQDTESEHSDSKDLAKGDSFVQANGLVKDLAKNAEESAPEVKQNTFRDLYDISGQTINQIKVKLTAETSHMEIQLNPEHLGKVEINISSKNGAVTAELTAHNEAAKRALEAGLEDLKTALNDNGLKVENLEVTLADYGFRQREEQERNGGNDGRRQGRRRVSLDMNDAAVDDSFETNSEIMKEMNGGSVDYAV